MQKDAMTINISTRELHEATGLSMPYCSQIVTGNRTPSQKAAIRIFRATGLKHPVIGGFSDELIDQLEATYK